MHNKSVDVTDASGIENTAFEDAGGATVDDKAQINAASKSMHILCNMHAQRTNSNINYPCRFL